jgi:hypothetical protein
MTARTVLLINQAWYQPPDDPVDIVVTADEENVCLAVAGGDAFVSLSHVDLRALGAFVFAATGGRATLRATSPSTAAPGVTGGPSDATMAAGSRVARPPDTAIIARLRELSPDGVTMPTRAAWDAQRGSLPHSTTLDVRRKWRDWAPLAGLRPMSAGKHLAPVEVVAEPPAAPFRANGTGAPSGLPDARHA